MVDKPPNGKLKIEHEPLKKPADSTKGQSDSPFLHNAAIIF
jgi:hypothetical protein